MHVARRPTLLNVPALGPSHPCQFLPESPNVRLRFRVTFRVGHQDANPPPLTGLLRARRQRPRGRTADQRDELAALQLIELHLVTARTGYGRRIIDFTTRVCWSFCNWIAGYTAHPSRVCNVFD